MRPLYVFDPYTKDICVIQGWYQQCGNYKWAIGPCRKKGLKWASYDIYTGIMILGGEMVKDVYTDTIASLDRIVAVWDNDARRRRSGKGSLLIQYNQMLRAVIPVQADIASWVIDYIYGPPPFGDPIYKGRN
jgi:hypothetical protein